MFDELSEEQPLRLKGSFNQIEEPNSIKVDKIDLSKYLQSSS